jgi:phage tail-like protein
MSTGAKKKVHVVEHFRLELDGKEGAGLFYTATTPSAQIQATDWQANSETYSPEPYRVKAQTKWNPIEVGRGIDDNLDLYTWFKTICETGIEENMKDIKIHLVDPKQQDVMTWNIINAWPSSYKASGVNSQSGEVAVESVQFTYDRAERIK